MNQPFNWQKLQNGSDIRGVALEGVPGELVNLTPEVVRVISQSFVIWLAQRQNQSPAALTISVGRDSRLSGPALTQATLESIAALGSRVYDFAMASTPAMFMSTITPGLNCDGAIMLTASHLPFNRNGLKFFTPQGGLQKQDISEILAIAAGDQNNLRNTLQTSAPQDKHDDIIAGDIIAYDFIAEYAGQLVQTIRQGVNHPQHYDQPLQGLKIIVDAGNGAGGFYAAQVLQPLGADTTGSQFLEPDGTFPNHVPNPEDEAAMQSICQAVIDHQADFGIIFDTDVDRSAAVDHTGKELNRNRLIALISAIILREHPGTTIVTDSITSEGLTQFIEQDLHGIHHRFKRGYKNVIDEALRLNESGQESWLAIETSGHAALKENYFLDDGAYLVSKLLIELAKSKLAHQSLPDLIATLKEPAESVEYRLKIKTEDFKQYGDRVLEALQGFVRNQPNWAIVPHTYEGLRVSCPDPSEGGWFLLRLSLHDPVMPLNIESNHQGGTAIISARLLEFFLTMDGLELPQALQHSC